jgi:hypothetical protein
MSAQTVFPQPLCPPVFLVLELLLVADFPGPDAQDLGGRVALDAALQDGDNFGGELRGGAGAVRYGGGLEAVELVQDIVY